MNKSVSNIDILNL